MNRNSSQLADEWRKKTTAVSSDAEYQRLQGVVLFEFELIKRIAKIKEGK